MATLLMHESRRMLIPLELAVDAVLELDWEHGGWLAEAQLIEARIEAGEHPALVIAVRREDLTNPETRSYPLPAVAAAIIHMCRKSKIPLPRDWEKRIEIVPEGFEFKLEGDVKIQRRHGALPDGKAPATTASASASSPATATSSPPASDERSVA
jgi:hypothetical protein